MTKLSHVLGAFLLLLLPSPTFANPVSFKDGWGIMPTFTPDWSDLQLNYSLSSKHAVGASLMYREGKDRTATFVLGQYNLLLKRWNAPESQANLYLSGGAGGRHEEGGSDAVAGYAAFEANYETRRVYTSASGESLRSPDGINFTRLRYRAGFAPYKAPIDELQTWIIGQFDYMPEMKDEISVTPLLRLFYNNLALEIGVNLEGTSFLAGMAHF